MSPMRRRGPLSQRAIFSRGGGQRLALIGAVDYQMIGEVSSRPLPCVPEGMASRMWPRVRLEAPSAPVSYRCSRLGEGRTDTPQ